MMMIMMLIIIIITLNDRLPNLIMMIYLSLIWAIYFKFIINEIFQISKISNDDVGGDDILIF